MPHLEDHPLACIFPLMGESDLQALADDIEANGLRDAVWLYEGKILDGRNRYRACVAKDIDHRVEHYKGKDPLGFSISKNLHRRHMTESQRAVSAARFANLQIDQTGDIRKSVTHAAGMFSVSARSVDSARDLLSEGVPELVAAVDAGDVAVSAAADVAQLPDDEQREAVAAGTVKEKAKELREKKAPEKKDPEKAAGKALLADPARTDQDIADELGTTAAVVGKVRRDLEAIGRITYPSKSDPEPDHVVASPPPPPPPPAPGEVTDDATGPESVDVNFGGAGDCKKAAASLLRLVKRIRAGVSCLVGSTYGDQVRNVFAAHAVTELNRTGKQTDLGSYGGVITVGPPEWNCTALDELGGQLASCVQVFDRIDRQPVQPRGGEHHPAPWESVEHLADTGEEDVEL